MLGTLIQGTTIYTHSLSQFMVGRFLLGFGAQLATCGGPIYVAEMAHPAYRGVVTGLYNTFWYAATHTITTRLTKNHLAGGPERSPQAEPYADL